MINNVTPAGALFMRSLAINSPIMLGTGAICLFALKSFARFTEDVDMRHNKRTFLRAVALDKAITPAMLLFYEASADPVREALRALANEETPVAVISALRAALAVSL